MFKISFKTLGLISTLALTACGTAMAGQAQSWSLSRDMMTGIAVNPKGPWAFMQNSSGLHDPTKYTLLPTYSASCASYPLNCWHDSSSLASFGVPTATYTFNNGLSSFKVERGIPVLHPGPSSQVILRWKSLVTGTISILGRVSDIDSACGDGIKWSLEIGKTIVQSGALANGTGSTFIAQNLPVTAGAALYFIVDAGSGYDCDSTNLDLIVTSQQ